jgi:hypothetical protein
MVLIFESATCGSVKVAVHFNVEPHGGYYGPALYEILSRAVMQAVPRDGRHVVIRSGSLLLSPFAGSAEDRERALDRFLRTPARMTINPQTFPADVAAHRVHAFSIEGLTRSTAERLDRALAEEPSFLVSVEVTASPIHWIIYDQSLIPKFRIVRDELRMFYEKEEYEAGGDRDNVMFDEWGSSGIFTTVEWEDTGLRGTIFDEHDTFENAQRLAEVKNSSGYRWRLS